MDNLPLLTLLGTWVVAAISLYATRRNHHLTHTLALERQEQKGTMDEAREQHTAAFNTQLEKIVRDYQDQLDLKRSRELEALKSDLSRDQAKYIEEVKHQLVLSQGQSYLESQHALELNRQHHLMFYKRHLEVVEDMFVSLRLLIVLLVEASRDSKAQKTSWTDTLQNAFHTFYDASSRARLYLDSDSVEKMDELWSKLRKLELVRTTRFTDPNPGLDVQSAVALAEVFLGQLDFPRVVEELKKFELILRTQIQKHVVNP